MPLQLHHFLAPHNHSVILTRNVCTSAFSKALWRYQQSCLGPSGFRQRSTLIHHFSTSTTSSPRQLSVIFFGSDNFSIESLTLLRSKLIINDNLTQHILHQNNVSIKQLEVVTTSKNNHVHNYCRKVDLPCHFFDTYTVPIHLFDLGVVSSFGRLIPKQMIEACHYGILNIHGSLLPRWRGASPIQQAILANDKVTGLTIMRIKPKKFDVGQIVAQRKIEILHRITALDLRRMMAPLGAQLLWECIENLDQSLASARDQSEEGVTHASKLKECDGEIDWNQMDSAVIDRRCRAFVGCIELYTHWIDGTQLRLGDVVDPDLVARLDIPTLSGCGAGHIPGLVWYHKKRHLLCVASANGTWSAFRSLTLKGRRKMSALGFYNTFIRPITKLYRQSNLGQKPVFILGNNTELSYLQSAQLEARHLVGMHNFEQVQSISAQLKL